LENKFNIIFYKAEHSFGFFFEKKLSLLKITAMNNLFLSLTCLFLIGNSFAFERESNPRDTSKGIINKALAVKLLNDGIELYSIGQNKDALGKFKDAATKDPSNWKAMFYISLANYDLNFYSLSLSQAKSAWKLSEGKPSSDFYEHFAKVNHAMGHLDTALRYYNLANQELSGSLKKIFQIPVRIQQVEFALKEKAANKLVKKSILSRNVNSNYAEYGPILADSGRVLYFTARKSDTKGRTMNTDDQDYFEDIYMSLWNAEINDWDSLTNALKWNTKGFDALTYVSSDGKYALMTINNESLEKATTSSSDIFELSLSTSTGKWGSPKAIENKSINSSYYDGSATMTADRKTMYFVSDRKGDKKSTDIYRVQKTGNEWGKAEALPDYINTTGRETTPYITPDGKFLFFSSDGLPGMGGLDIYVSELKGGVFGQPVNLGSLVNSYTDDTHFSYYPEFKKGFVASVTTSGEKANYDLYEIDLSDFSLPIK
jgi:Tol biopolymer transport system component